MTMRVWPIAVAVIGLGAGVALAQHHHHQRTHPQPYAGQQDRAVASLSAEDVQGFLAGRGMGLAKAAELNGFPGPMHVLELEQELKLSAEQRGQVQRAFERMKARAMELGAQYVSAEKAVDEAFAAGMADAANVAARAAEANRLLGEVRLSHLLAHLEITSLLSPEQRARYAELRGYGAGRADQHRHKH